MSNTKTNMVNNFFIGAFSFNPWFYSRALFQSRTRISRIFPIFRDACIV